MVVFLESNLGLAILAGVAFLGILMKLMVGRRYRRIMRQVEKIDTTKDKYVKSWKKQFEELSNIRNGISNVAIFSEKCLQRYRKWGLSLRGWNALSNLMVILTLFGGLLGGFGAYWYALDYRVMILHGSAGVVLAGAALVTGVLVDSTAKEDQALVALQDVLENNLLPRIEEERYHTRGVLTPQPLQTPTITLDPEDEKILEDVFREYLT